MHHSLKEWKKELDNSLRKIYFSPICDFCHNELIMSYDKAEIVLFEPKEVEHEVTDIVLDSRQPHKITDTKKRIEKCIESSDTNKDIFKFKCPVCGHIIEITREELFKLHVSYYGDNNIRFELDEVETERARKFKKKHNHTAEIKAQENLDFTPIGQQFTYEITPGYLGISVIIRCNHCGEKENITNSDSL